MAMVREVCAAGTALYVLLAGAERGRPKEMTAFPRILQPVLPLAPGKRNAPENAPGNTGTKSYRLVGLAQRNGTNHRMVQMLRTMVAPGANREIAALLVGGLAWPVGVSVSGVAVCLRGPWAPMELAAPEKGRSCRVQSRRRAVPKPTAAVTMWG